MTAFEQTVINHLNYLTKRIDEVYNIAIGNRVKVAIIGGMAGMFTAAILSFLIG